MLVCVKVSHGLAGLLAYRPRREVHASRAACHLADPCGNCGKQVLPESEGLREKLDCVCLVPHVSDLEPVVSLGLFNLRVVVHQEVLGEHYFTNT
jgi:hypothetical protein